MHQLCNHPLYTTINHYQQSLDIYHYYHVINHQYVQLSFAIIIYHYPLASLIMSYHVINDQYVHRNNYDQS